MPMYHFQICFHVSSYKASWLFTKKNGSSPDYFLMIIGHRTNMHILIKFIFHSVRAFYLLVYQQKHLVVYDVHQIVNLLKIAQECISIADFSHKCF